jgi:AsmA family protein
MTAARARSGPRLRLWRIGTAILACLTLFVTAIAAFVIFVDLYPDRAVSWAVPFVSKSTGRELKLGGPTDLRLISWRPRLVLNDVSFANAEWSKEKQMFQARRVEIAVALRRLLRTRTMAFTRVRLDDATLRLEQRADGTNNWTLWASEVAKPEDRSDVPAIRRLELRGSRVLYSKEGAAESATDLLIQQASGKVAREVRLQGQGTYQKNSARIDVRAGSIAQLQDMRKAFPLDVDLHAGPTSASMKGHLVGGLESGGLDVTMRIKGETLSELYPLIGVVLPKSPPYQLTGKLGREGTVWKFTNFDGRMGDSDLSGDLKVDLAPEPPFMTASFRSKLLDFDDLAGLVGAPPATGAGETASSEQKAEVAATAAQGRVLPEQRIEVPRLQAMDIDARLVAARVHPPNHLPIDRLDLHLTLKDGILRADPATFDVAGGRVELVAALNSDRRPVHVDVDLKARGVEAARILGKTPFTDETHGKIAGGVKLAMAGNTLRELAASADGRAQVALANAQVSHLLLELMGLDIMESIGVFVQGDRPVEIRCAAFDLEAVNGKVRSDLAVIDTKDTTIAMNASLDLGTEKLSLRVDPRPKDVSFLSLRQNLIVEGRLADLDFYPDPLKLGPVKGAMQKLNYLLAPIVGLLTPFDLDAQEDDDDNGCAQFLAGQAVVAPGAQEKVVRDKRLLPTMKAPAVAARPSGSKSASSARAEKSKEPAVKSSSRSDGKGRIGGGFVAKLKERFDRPERSSKD